MAKKHLYSIRDAAVGAFNDPFAAFADSEATRSFQNLVDNPETQLAKHPHDFALFRLGSINDQNGQLQPESQPEQICTGLDMIRTLNNPTPTQRIQEIEDLKSELGTDPVN